MPNSPNQKDKLPRHSRAKVSLLQSYLVNYLSVLTNSRHINRIKIYDFFCGPGIYDDMGEGSPIAIIRTVKNTYFSRLAGNDRTPQIDCYFSDENPEHVESVANAIDTLHLHYPEIGKLICTPDKYQTKIQEFLSEGNKQNEKAFVFIDPYGYTDIKASEIRELLKKKAEVLLFLPIQFMYRFENEGPIKEFISGMRDFEGWTFTNSAFQFVERLRDTFRDYLGSDIYVSIFLIVKDPSTLFSLFFFTTHVLGHVKMIEAKWKIDKDAGIGWTFRAVPGQKTLIPDIETLMLETELFEFLKGGNKDNCDVFEFAVIDREHPAKHATQVCKKLLADGRLKVSNISHEPAKTGAFYTNYDNYKDGIKRVQFEVI